MFGSGLGNFHADVLNAEPSDNDSKLRLVCEIKERAKGSIKSRNFPEAIQLYSKAVDVSSSMPENLRNNQDFAILYANRSMCELEVNNADRALTDATTAIEIDSSYLKGYFRKSAALVKLRRHCEARQSCLDALALYPGEKSFISQLKSIDEMIAKGDSQEQPTSDARPASVQSTASTRTSSSSTAAKASTAATQSSKESEDSKDADEAAIGQVRGYKKTVDGRMTTFFNTELDQETKRLIGDIAPKKLDAAAVESEQSNSGSGSAWNSAGTYEERVHSAWALARLSELLSSACCSVAVTGEQSPVTVLASVQSAVGDAQVTLARNRKKHVYDFSVSLLFKHMDCTLASMTLEDITSDRQYEIVTVFPSSAAAAGSVWDTAAARSALEQTVTRLLEQFDDEFKTK